ncbi:MAG: glycosyltransferase family 4 protein [Chthoniobacterales bacterium]
MKSRPPANFQSLNNARLKVGLDLAPIGFRERAPGTAVLVENQALALLALKVEWDWVLIATPRVLADSPFFASFNPIVVPDAPLSLHVSFRLGRLWAKQNCALGLATAFFIPFFGPPVVTNYFDANAFHQLPDTRKPWVRLKSAVIGPLWKMSRRRSRALFILSDYGRRRMIEVDPTTAAKWVVAPCGCRPIQPCPGQIPQWAAGLESRPFILYAADLSENKNQRRLIDAWGLLRSRCSTLPPLVLLGPGDPDYLREVIEPARAQTGHPADILIPGFVSATDLAWAFRSASAYVQPSFAEGFGMPVIEAMSCGLPVACSDSTSLPEVAGGAAVLFDPTRAESIAEALETIVQDEEARVRLKTAGLRRAENFTWERNAEIVSQRIREELRVISSMRTRQ